MEGYKVHSLDEGGERLFRSNGLLEGNQIAVGRHKRNGKRARRMFLVGRHIMIGWT